jgi:hypothetical protein
LKIHPAVQKLGGSFGSSFAISLQLSQQFENTSSGSKVDGSFGSSFAIK